MSRPRYRIIQWGTGNVGRHALRTIVERPDYELVGVRVYSPEKVGVDAGALFGGAPTGVIATDDVDAILALDADCVCYAALGGATRGGTEAALTDICRLLASGKNVVSSAVEHHAYLRPGTEVPRAGTHAYERLTKACAEGESTFFQTAINPGFAMDLWPMSLTRMSRRIDHLRVTEVVDMRRYTMHMIHVMGLGKTPDELTLLDANLGDLDRSPLYIPMQILSDALGVELDDVRYSREVAITDQPLELAAGTIAAGTIAALKLAYDGMLYGRAAITLEWIWRVTNDIASEWPTGDSRWLLHIDGDPTIDAEFSLATTHDARRATSLAAATLLLNSVPTICAAAPGLLNNLTLPAHAGGYFQP